MPNERDNTQRNVAAKGTPEQERELEKQFAELDAEINKELNSSMGLPRMDKADIDARKNPNAQSPNDQSPNQQSKPKDGYEDLRRILQAAYQQSAAGKGKKRHSSGPMGVKPWDRQPILEIGRMVGPGYATGQAQKKLQEAVTLVGNGEYVAAKNELLGAVVYAAAAFKLVEEMETNHK